MAWPFDPRTTREVEDTRSLVNYKPMSKKKRVRAPHHVGTQPHMRGEPEDKS